MHRGFGPLGRESQGIRYPIGMRTQRIRTQIRTMTGLELAAIALGMSARKVEEYLRNNVEADVDCDGDGYFIREFDINELDFSDIAEFFHESILTSSQQFWISVCAEVDSFGNLHFKDCERLFKLHGGDWIEWTLDQPYGTPIRNVGVLKAALGH